MADRINRCALGGGADAADALHGILYADPKIYRSEGAIWTVDLYF